MVNSISYTGPAIPDAASKSSTPATLPALGTTSSASPKVDVAPLGSTQQVEEQAAPAVPAQPLVNTQPLAPPLTSLAIYRDSESGMEVSVQRDRLTGQVVNQFPTERARRLAAMVKQQEAVAQELQQNASGTPHIDLQT